MSSRIYTKFWHQVPVRFKASTGPRWWCWWCCYSGTEKRELTRHYIEHHPLYLEEERPHWLAQIYRDTKHYLKEINGDVNGEWELDDEYKAFRANEEERVVYICSKGQEYVVPFDKLEEFLKTAPV